jgi:CHAD domain-containing protein
VQALSLAIGAIRSASDVVAVHRARIETKRLRYLLEPLRGARPVVDRLKALQDLLGELHDAHVLENVLRGVLEDRVAPRARPGVVALLRLVRERRDALAAELVSERRAGVLDALALRARALAMGAERPSAHPPRRRHIRRHARRTGA